MPEISSRSVIISLLALIHTGVSLSLRLPDGDAGSSSASTAAQPLGAGAPPGPGARHVPPLEEFEEWLSLRDEEDAPFQRDHHAAASEGAAALRLLVGVFSRAGAEDRPYRDAIRRSWMRRPGVCAALDYQPWSADCSLYASFVVGNNEACPGEQAMTVLKVQENMNCGKTMVWLQHAATAFPWATHLIKMDMDSYPRFDLVMDQLPASKGCPNYYGGMHQDGTRNCIGVPSRPWCPAPDCGRPLGGDFLKYGSKDPACFGYVNGGFSVLTRQLALEISRPGGWWEAAARRCEPEDVTTGHAVHEYATRTGACVATSNLTGLRHLR